MLAEAVGRCVSVRSGDQTFVYILGHAPLKQLEIVERRGIVCERVTVYACGIRSLVGIHHDIGRIYGHRVGNTGKCRNRLNILIGKSESAFYIEIEQAQTVVICVGGEAHIRCRRKKTREKPDAEKHDSHYREKASERPPQRPYLEFCVCVFHYHSISSTGVGEGFTSVFTTIPFLT